MLYDELGRPFVEPPLIPEEQHLMYIVKDYRRMYNEFSRIEQKNRRLRESLKQLSGLQYAQRRLIAEYIEAIRHCAKYMRKNGLELSPFLTDFINRKLL